MPPHRVARTQLNVVDKRPIIRLRLCDHYGRPVANTDYELTLDGTELPGRTDGNGWTEEFDATEVREGKLAIEGFSYEVNFEDEEIDDTKHAQSLLNALGFNAGPLDGDRRRRTIDATCSFQREHNFEATGELDDRTLEEMKKEHRVK